MGYNNIKSTTTFNSFKIIIIFLFTIHIKQSTSIHLFKQNLEAKIMDLCLMDNSYNNNNNTCVNNNNN